MPKRKAAEHHYNQDFVPTSDGTKAISDVWYAVLARQPYTEFWLSTCKQIAYNLGEQWVSVDSIRGADEVTVKAVSEVAFTGIKSPKLGVQMTLKRVLEQLQQGVLCKQWNIVSGYLVPLMSCKDLTAGPPCRSCNCRLFYGQAPWRGPGNCKYQVLGVSGRYGRKVWGCCLGRA